MPNVLDTEQSLLLEISPPFDQREVHFARRRMAKVWHPDIAPRASSSSTTASFHAPYSYAEEFFGPVIQPLHAFHDRARRGGARLYPFDLRTARSHTPKDCLTPRFDPGRLA